jgi:hypothetical protein
VFLCECFACLPAIHLQLLKRKSEMKRKCFEGVAVYPKHVDAHTATMVGVWHCRDVSDARRWRRRCQKTAGTSCQVCGRNTWRQVGIAATAGLSCSQPYACNEVRPFSSRAALRGSLFFIFNFVILQLCPIIWRDERWASLTS